MSRTHKDEPRWVRGRRHRSRRLHHDWFCEDNADGRYGSFFRIYHPERIHPCNIDNPQSRSYGAGARGLCYWDFPDWDHRSHYSYCTGVPKWFRDHRWNNPSRVEERVRLTDAAKQYRATGEVDDIVFDHNYHHHGAGRDFW